MKCDIFGEELHLGDLVLGTSSTVSISASSCGLYVGVDEVYKLDNKSKSGKVIKCSNILKLDVNNESKKNIYEKLRENYKEYSKQCVNYMLKNQELNFGDIVYIEKHSGKYVYLGEWSFERVYKSNKSYVYLKYSTYKDLENMRRSAGKNLRVIDLFKFLNVYSNNGFLIVDKCLNCKEIVGKVNLQGIPKDMGVKTSFGYYLKAYYWGQVNVDESEEM